MVMILSNEVQLSEKYVEELGSHIKYTHQQNMLANTKLPRLRKSQSWKSTALPGKKGVGLTAKGILYRTRLSSSNQAPVTGYSWLPPICYQEISKPLLGGRDYQSSDTETDPGLPMPAKVTKSWIKQNLTHFKQDFSEQEGYPRERGPAAGEGAFQPTTSLLSPPVEPLHIGSPEISDRSRHRLHRGFGVRRHNREASAKGQCKCSRCHSEKEADDRRRQSWGHYPSLSNNI